MSNGLILPSTALTPFCKRFTKNELTATGEKLAFLDINVLSRLFSNQYVKEEDIISKFSGIIPVLNLNLLTELLKGIDLKNERHAKYVNKKRKIIRFLASCQTVWVLEHQFIQCFEYLNSFEKRNVYDHCKVFSQYPGSWIIDNKRKWLYPCDRGMRGNFVPYESIVKNNGSLEAFLDQLLGDLESLKNELTVGSTKNEKEVESSRAHLNNLSPESRSNKRREIDAHYIRVLLRQNTHCKENYIEQIVVQMQQEYDFDKPSFLSHAPYYSIENYIYQLKLDQGLKETNDFIDSEYIKIALSYCDLFITNDGTGKNKEGKLQTKVKTIIKKMNLPVKICDFNDKNLDITDCITQQLIN
jgi:hypothetical protein